MRSLDELEIVSLWETAGPRHAIDRALAILAATTEEGDTTTLADLPISARDRRLLESRAALFGPQVTTAADCGSCGERMEFSFAVDEVLDSAPGDDLPVDARHEGIRIRLRQPTSRDLAAVADISPEAAPRRLIERLVVTLETGDGERAVGGLSDAGVAAAGEALRRAAPDSEIEIEAVCPCCGARADHLFDPLAQIWAEIDATAQRVLLDVHGLASAYGWTEREILALPPARRRRYLELAGR